MHPVRSLAADELAPDERDTRAAFGRRTDKVLAGAPTTKTITS
jgi:hypothetical protein